MRLRRVDLAGFGCLTDFTADFGPGLNVLFGENEAGKSTLQQALCSLLYGFYDNDRARPDETARHDRFRPWPDGARRRRSAGLSSTSCMTEGRSRRGATFRRRTSQRN